MVFKLKWSLQSNHYPKEEAMTCQKTHKTTNLRKRCTYWATRDLAKGTTCNTITLKKVAATVATKADLNFKILGGKKIS